MAVDLVIELDRRAPATLAQQIATAVRGSIADQRIAADERLPSTRTLSAELGVARAVVQQAYDQLAAEGWARGRHGAGTYVRTVTALRAHAPRPTARRRRPADDVVSLRPGIPWGERTASPAWRRAWRTVSATPMPSGYPDAQGLPALRGEVCGYLGRARGIACTPDEVVITAGSAHAFRLLLAATMQPGSRVAVEDPGYRSAVHAVRDRHLHLIDVPVDEHGLDVDTLHRLRPAPEIVYTTPSHQHPTGVPLPVARRHELVAWARRSGGLVVEDDYDSEFRYDVAPMPALAQLDRAHVAYLGTSSKTFGPGLRLGWLLADAERVAQILEHRTAVTDVPSWPVQVAYTSLLAEGYVDTVVRRERRRYAERSARVCRVVEPFGAVTGRSAGLHVTLRLPVGVDVAVRDDALRAGVEVPILADFTRSNRCPAGLVVGYGGLTDDELDRALGVLVSALRSRQ